MLASMFSVAPARFRRIGVDAARHAVEPEDVHREERHVEADEEQPEIPLAEPLAQHAAGDLREPVVERAEQREHRAADQHVVEMRDDEERVVHLQVERHRREHHAGQAADRRTMTKKPSTNSIGVPDRRAARPTSSRSSRRSASPVGIAIIMLAAVKKLCAELRQAGREHVVHPQAEADEAVAMSDSTSAM